MTLLLRWVINALGVMVAAWLLPGIWYEDNTAMIIVVVLLGLFNAFLKPMLVFATLPFVVMTLGFGVLLINAALFLLAASLVKGFRVDGFWWAFLGALIVSAINLVVGRALGDTPAQRRDRRRHGGSRRDRDVIDI
jgi:putative membrane protein